MSDNKTYYYMRLKEHFFDEPEIKIIEGMPDGYLYSNILLKMYLVSLEQEGRLMFNDIIPYNPEMIASVTGHNVGAVKQALTIFKDYGLIDILDNGAIYMLGIQHLIGKSSTEADRQRAYDRRIADEKKAARNLQDFCKISTPKIEIEKEIELEIEKEIEIEGEASPQKQSIPYTQIINTFNQICVSYPRVIAANDARKKAIRARLNTYSEADFTTLFEKAEASDFLKGKNERNWSANFDWLIADKNMAKVLEGNYDNKGAAGKKKTKLDEHMEYYQRLLDEGK